MTKPKQDRELLPSELKVAKRLEEKAQMLAVAAGSVAYARTESELKRAMRNMNRVWREMEPVYAVLNDGSAANL